MAKLDIDWLNVFIEVYKTQSVSLAAQRLSMAQANASACLGKLRRHFGDPLFCRTSRGMEPTPYASRSTPRCWPPWRAWPHWPASAMPSIRPLQNGGFASA